MAMTFDEALSLAIEGARVRCTTMQPGCYVEHSFSRGFLRCWAVDRVEDEPGRTQCDYHATEIEKASLWSELERPKIDSWGRPLNGAPASSLAPPPNAAPAVPWGNLKLNTAPPPQGQGWGSGAPPAPKRDTWGRPIG